MDLEYMNLYLGALRKLWVWRIWIVSILDLDFMNLLRSSEDEDYGSGAYESDDEIGPAEPRRVRLTSTISSVSNTSKRQAAKKR